MKKLAIILILLFSTLSIYAQSSEVITDILNTEKVTFGQVCYLSAVQQDFVDDTATYAEAINALYRKGQIPSLVYEDTTIPMVNIAYIYAQMWEVKGGILYRIFRGAPRYAFKQLKADGVISSNVDPKAVISGMEALNLYTACSIEYGKLQLNVD